METPRARSTRRRQTGVDTNVESETPRRSLRRSGRTTTGGGRGSAVDVAVASPNFINSRQVLNSLSAPQSAAQVTTGLLLNEYSPSVTHSTRHGNHLESAISTPQRSVQRPVAPSHIASAAHHYYEHSPARDTAMRRRQQIEPHQQPQYGGCPTADDGGANEGRNKSRMVWTVLSLCFIVVGLRVYSSKRSGVVEHKELTGQLQGDSAAQVKVVNDALLTEGSDEFKNQIVNLIEERVSKTAVELTSKLHAQLEDSMKEVKSAMTQVRQDLTNSKAHTADIESDYQDYDSGLKELVKRVESVEGDLKRDEDFLRLTALIEELRGDVTTLREKSPKTTSAVDVVKTSKTSSQRPTALSAANPIVDGISYGFEDLLMVVEQLWNDVHLSSGGVINWALKSLGATVVRQMTTLGIGEDSWRETALRVVTASALTSRWSGVTYPRSANPDVLLTRGPPSPGDSFSFRDLPGNVTIQLSRAISVSEVALEQVLPELTPRTDIAPHTFQVWGWADPHMSGCTPESNSDDPSANGMKCAGQDSKPVLIAENLTFEYPLYRLQMFPTNIVTSKGCIMSKEVQQDDTEECGRKLYFRRITFEFLTNQGGLWTSVGRVRVHGSPSPLSAPPFVTPDGDPETVLERSS